MIHRLSLLAFSLLLLFAATAEATTGHCAKADMQAAPAMSAHCAEMMGEDMSGMDMPDAPIEAPDQSDAAVCCCAISVTPVLFDQPVPDGPSIVRATWAAPSAITGPPGATFVDLPPPRI